MNRTAAFVGSDRDGARAPRWRGQVRPHTSRRLNVPSSPSADSPDGYLGPLVALARAQAQEETGRGKRGTSSGGQGHGLDRRLLAHVPFQTPVLVTSRSPGFNGMKKSRIGSEKTIRPTREQQILDCECATCELSASGKAGGGRQHADAGALQQASKIERLTAYRPAGRGARLSRIENARPSCRKYGARASSPWKATNRAFPGCI